MRSALLLILLVVAPLWGGPTLVLPKEVKGEPGAFLRVVADTPGKVVKWRPVDPGLNLFPVDLLKDTKVAVVVALKPGRYRLQAVTALADEPSDIVETVVVVGEVPPDPGPEPGPTPEPTDPLAKALKTLYVATADPKKAEYVKALASVYKQGAGFVDGDAITTAGDLYAKLAGVSGAMMPRQALQSVRDQIAAELKKALPTNAETQLTADHRKAAKALFTKLAGILEGLSK